MTDLEKWLSEVEARLNAATPGPWRATKMGTQDTYMFSASDDVMLSNAPYDETTCDLSAHDFELIAHSRTDLERAVKVIRELMARGE